MTPLSGFVPDVDPATAGVLIDCTNTIPDANGMKGAPTLVSVSDAPALAAACRGAVVATKLDDTRRIFAGSSSKLYELSAGSWSDVSRGTSYSLGSDDRWSFVQFGNATLASNKTTEIQRSNSSGAFSDISGAPKAKIICAASGFVMALDVNNATYGDSPDRWYCCALNDETDWTVSTTTLSNTGRIVSAPGPITAGAALGDQIVAYKANAIYLASFVGSPDVWDFQRIPSDLGCVGVRGVADIAGVGHGVVSRNDIYIFDGTRPQSIAEGKLRQWFYSNVSQAYLSRTQVLHDRQSNLLWVFYPSTGSTGSLDSALAYHLGRGVWGRMTVTIEEALQYVGTGLTWDTLNTIAATWNAMPDVSWDSQFWLSGGRFAAVFNSSHQICSMTGASSTSSMTLFDVGDDQSVSHLTRLRVAYQDDPTSATCQGFVRMSRGEIPSDGSSGTYSSGKFDLRQKGRFHRVRVDNVGPWLAQFVDFDFRPGGRR